MRSDTTGLTKGTKASRSVVHPEIDDAYVVQISCVGATPHRAQVDRPRHLYKLRPALFARYISESVLFFKIHFCTPHTYLGYRNDHITVVRYRQAKSSNRLTLPNKPLTGKLGPHGLHAGKTKATQHA